MVFIFNVLVLLLVHSYVVDSFPLLRNITAEVTTSHNTLRDLVNSKENRLVFSKLQHSQSSFFDKQNNVVGTIDFPTLNQYQRQPYVSNGYLGSRIANLGQGFTYDQKDDKGIPDDVLNGWPLFNKRYNGAFVAGFFDAQVNTTGTNFPELLDNGWESVIASVPQWASLLVSVKKDDRTYVLDPAHPDSIGSITHYTQNLSLANGIVTTQFVWLDTLAVRVDVFAHRSLITSGLVDLHISNLGSDPVDISVVDLLSIDTCERSTLLKELNDNDGIAISFTPDGVADAFGAIYSKVTGPGERTAKGSSQTLAYTLESHANSRFSKVVGVVTRDLDDTLNSQKLVLNKAKANALAVTDVDAFINSHKVAWDHTLGATVAVTFPDDDLLTLASRSSVFHLAANTRPHAEGVTGALGVSGLSSDSYGGMVFWDTDLWMMGGLLPFIPSHTTSFVNYRSHLHEQARQNARDGGYDKGAVYPWTSGRYGNCTGTGPCLDYEYHLNWDIAKAAFDLYLSGNANEAFLESVAYPFIEDAALLYADYVEYNQTLAQYTTSNLTDPDEYANHIDNGAFTNAAISLTMQWALDLAGYFNKTVPPIFSKINSNMHMPVSDVDRITLEYTGMNNSIGIKQADVIMVTFPLENELVSEEQAHTNMQYYSMKQVSYGPAMTFPIFSTVAATLASEGCASQSYLHKAVQPFLRAPFAQFSEQNNDNFVENRGTHPAFPFLTAHGGFLQAALYGLTGWRFAYDYDDGQLLRVLHLDPIALPCLPQGVLFEGLHYMNQLLALHLNETHLTVRSDKNNDDSFTVRVAERNKNSGVYEVSPGDVLSIAVYSTDIGMPGSISECGQATFTNITEGAFGDSPFSINDGDNTTHWQARYNDTTAKVIVDLKHIKNVSHGYLNWGDRPPKEVRLSYVSPDTAAQYSLHDTTDFLTNVDFGNDLHSYYAFGTGEVHAQDDVFTNLVDELVEPSAPFNQKEYLTVQLPPRHNITTFDLGVASQFVLIEYKGIHNTVPIDGNTGGASLYQVVLYD